MEQINELSLKSKITLVLDEHLFVLREALENYGFRVLVYKQGLKDFELTPYLTGKAIITQDLEDFSIDAIIHDFDIILIKDIKFIDSKKDRSNSTVQKIAEAIRGSKIYSLKGNWLLTIYDDGSYETEELH